MAVALLMSNPLQITKICVCGRIFTDLGGFTRHEKSCHKGKKRLASALAKAKEIYIAKKARLSLSGNSSVDQDAITSSSRDGVDVSQASEQATHPVCMIAEIIYFKSDTLVKGVSYSLSLHRESTIGDTEEVDIAEHPGVCVDSFFVSTL